MLNCLLELFFKDPPVSYRCSNKCSQWSLWSFQGCTKPPFHLMGLWEASNSISFAPSAIKEVKLHTDSRVLLFLFRFLWKENQVPSRGGENTWILYQLLPFATNQKGQGVCFSNCLYKQTVTLPPAVPISHALPGIAGGGSQYGRVLKGGRRQLKKSPEKNEGALHNNSASGKPVLWKWRHQHAGTKSWLQSVHIQPETVQGKMTSQSLQYCVSRCIVTCRACLCVCKWTDGYPRLRRG